MNELKFRLSLDGAQQVATGANTATAALSKTGKAADDVAGSFGTLGTAAGSLRNLAGLVGAGTAVRDFVQIADSVTVLNNQLKLATGSATAATSAYNALFGIAQRSRTSFTDLGSTYASIARATDGLGISQARLLKVTESIGNAMAISGGSAAGMQAALTQLGQGLASGTLRGDELNSVLEQTPRLARAIADGMGVTVGQLRALGQEGKISAETIIKALESQSAVLTGEVQGAVLTVAQAWTVLGNSATKAIGQVDKATGTTGTVARQMQSWSRDIDDTADRYERARASQSDFINATPGLVAVGVVMATVQAHTMAAAEALGHVDASAANVGRRLAEAEKEADRLQKLLAQNGGIYLQSKAAEATELRDRLREAKAAQDALTAPDPRDQTKYRTRGQSYAAWDAEVSKSAQALAGARNTAMGVNDSWVKQLQALADARAKGLITEREHIALAQKLTQTTYQKAAATKKDADEMADAVKAYNDLAKAGRDWARGLNTTNAGLERQQDLGRELTEAETRHLELTQQLATGQLAMNAATEQAARAAIDYGQALRSNVAWQRQSADENAKSFESLTSQTAGLEARAEAMRKTNDAAGKTPAALREIEQAEHLANAAAKDRLATVFDSVDPAIAAEYRQQAAALREMGAQTGRAAGIESAAAAGEAWQRMAADAGQSLADELMDGGKSAGDYIKGYFRSLFGRELAGMFSSAIGSFGQYLGLSSAAGGGGAGGGANNWLSLLGTAGQAGGGWGNVASTVGSYLGFGGSTAAAGSSLGAVSAESLYGSMAAYEGITVSGSAAASTAGGTTAAAAGSSAASAIPIIGWIIAAIMASKAAYEGGNTLSMLDGKTDYGVGKFEADKYDTLQSLGVSEEWSQILSGAPLTARLFGSKASVSGFGVGSVVGGDFVQEDRAPISFGVNKLGGGADEGLQDLASRIAGGITLSAGMFGGGLTQGLRVGAVTDRDRENEAAALLGFFGADNKLIAGVQTGSGAFGAGGPGKAASKIAVGENDAELNKWLAEQMPVLIVQGLQQSDLADRFDAYFDSVAASALKPDVAANMLATATSVQQFADAFGPLGGVFDQFETASIDTIAKTAKAAGNFETLTSAAAAYGDRFYSEAERTAIATGRVSDALADVGLAMPSLASGADQARQQFRALVDAQDLGTKAGRETFAMLMSVAGAFDELASSAQQAQGRLQDAIGQVLPKFQTQDERTQGQYQSIAVDLRAAGVTVDVGALMGASKDDIEAFARSFVSLGSNSIEARTAVVIAAGALADLKDSAAESAAAIANQQAGLYIELQQALGNETTATALARQQELDALRLLNPALAQTKKLIYDATDAANAAARVQKIVGGVDSVAGDFLSGAELQGYLSGRISEILAGGGIDADVGAIMASTKDQVVELFRAVGIDGKEAILEALPLWQQMTGAIDTAADAQRRFTDDLLKFTGSLKFGDLSPLGAQAQLDAAQAQYASTLAKAQAGDETARGDLTSVAQALLSEAQSAYASGGAYTGIFDKVIGDLDALALNGTTAAGLTGPTFVSGPAGSSGGLSGAPQPLDLTPLTAPALMEGFSSASADRQFGRLEAKLAEVVAQQQTQIARLDALIGVEQIGHTQNIAGLAAIQGEQAELVTQARLANGQALAHQHP